MCICGIWSIGHDSDTPTAEDVKYGMVWYVWQVCIKALQAEIKPQQCLDTAGVWILVLLGGDWFKKKGVPILLGRQS